RRAGGPVEVLAACGHGRSYIAWSRFLAIRHLPGIAGCGLWQALEDRPGLSTVALLTDAGNDLVYGAPVPAIVRGIEACLEKLAARRAQIVLTPLPLARLAGAGAGARRAAAPAGPRARRPDGGAGGLLVRDRSHSPAPEPATGGLGATD